MKPTKVDVFCSLSKLLYIKQGRRSKTSTTYYRCLISKQPYYATSVFLFSNYNASLRPVLPASLFYYLRSTIIVALCVPFYSHFSFPTTMEALGSCGVWAQRQQPSQKAHRHITYCYEGSQMKPQISRVFSPARSEPRSQKMTTPARAQSILLAAVSPCVSASGCLEKSSAGPQVTTLTIQ